MSCTATLRRSGGSIILAIPKALADSLAVDAGSVVQLSLNGRSLAVQLMSSSGKFYWSKTYAPASAEASRKRRRHTSASTAFMSRVPPTPVEDCR